MAELRAKASDEMRAAGAWSRLPGRALRAFAFSTLGGLLLPLAGCNNFFQCENKPACPATSTSTGSGSSSGSGSTVDYAFVSYTTTDSAGNPTSTLKGYNIASGALTAINSVTLPFVPIAMAVNPANSILYVASVPGYSDPGIYEYAIATDGTLSVANGGAALVTDPVGAMTISPDGNYLYTLEAAGLNMIQYAVNSSTGALATGGTVGTPSLSCVPAVSPVVLPGCSVAVSPKKDYVVASFGTSGTAIYSYSSSSGITNATPTVLTPATGSGDFAVAIDGNDNALIARTVSLGGYELASLVASPSTYTGQSVAIASGTIPRSTVVDPDSKFVYTADVGLGKISGFSIGSTALPTALTSSPYSGPANVASLGIDSTDTYLVAAGFDATAGLQLYSIAASGVLTPIVSAATTTATAYPVLVAMSH
jgi:6-phosphogluconolactonase